MRCSPTGRIFSSKPQHYRTSQSSAAQPCDMAPEVLEFGYHNIPEEVMSILKEAWRTTTRACYAAKLKCFLQYCILKDNIPLTASVQHICCLFHLQKSGLAYTSICMHLAAVAAYLQNRQHISLFRIPVIKAFMDGLKRIIPPQTPPAPIWRIIPPRTPPAPVWNLDLVLTRLMGPLFEPLHSCPLQFLCWKVAFLVAITSLRRVCEIHALALEEIFPQVHKDSGSQNQSKIHG